MNKGFMMYEALIVFFIISFIIISSLSLNTNVMNENRKIENKIVNLIKNKYQKIESCDINCLIKKALWQ
ncbi:competence protein ComGC [Bacilli bacterium PM5-3]|nr:competence protein ComGC [Bacilli bacterium PM5-3]